MDPGADDEVMAGEAGEADEAGEAGVIGVGHARRSRRTSRSAGRIVIAVGVAVVVLAGLAGWVLGAPYSASAGAQDLRCDARIDWTPDPSGRQAAARFARACDDAHRDRRNVALLVGAGVAIAACAVSTVPSRRLTGDKLGPLR